MNSDSQTPLVAASAQNSHDHPSKSQIKRDLLALFTLGKQLVELAPDRLQQLPLSEDLYAAVREAQRIRSLKGRQRQIHFVGKLLRAAQVAAIQTQLDTWENGSYAETAALHRLETLRTELLNKDAALTTLLHQHPHIDAQPLRACIRAARKEALANAKQTPDLMPQRKHYRALFQALKTLLV